MNDGWGDFLYVVLENARPAKDAALTRWHRAQLAAIRKLPHVAGAHHFAWNAVPTNSPPPAPAHRRVTIYRITGGRRAALKTRALIEAAGPGVAGRERARFLYRTISPRTRHGAPLRPMQRPVGSVYFVRTNPVPGREGAYNRWYTHRHLVDVTAVPGFVAAQRFKLVEGDEPVSHSYLALYEITGAPRRALNGLRKARHAGKIPISPAMQRDTEATVFVPVA